MKDGCYSTKEIADLAGVHANTVRYYEEIGFLTKPRRLGNGYRVYTALQLAQCRLIRVAMRAEILQNGLRAKAVELVRLCAALDFDGSLRAVDEYRAMLEREMRSARAAAAYVEEKLETQSAETTVCMKRRDAANALHVTAETLRTWERSGLIEIQRKENGYRVYTSADMERLNMIRTLRMARYSLSAILRLFNRLNRRGSGSVSSLLNTPCGEDEIISACDRLLLSLESAASDARWLREAVEKMKADFSTIQ